MDKPCVLMEICHPTSNQSAIEERKDWNESLDGPRLTSCCISQKREVKREYSPHLLTERLLQHKGEEGRRLTVGEASIGSHK